MSSEKRKQLIDNVATIVLAGGQGTRLFPLTESRCKPSVAFGGRYRLIDIPVSNSLNSGIRKIFVIAQYYASALFQHLSATYNGDLLGGGGIECLAPEEKPRGKIWFRGTADAVRQNLEYFLKLPVDYYLILSGDQLYNMHFLPMLEFAVSTQADLVVAALPVEEPEAKRMGLLKIDNASRILDFFEKPQNSEILKFFELPEKHKVRATLSSQKSHYLASMGIYVFRKQALVTLLKEEGNDFGKELIPFQVKKGGAFSYVYNGYWEDIGTIESYYKANLLLLTHQQHLNTYDERNPIYACPFRLPSPIIKETKIQNCLISNGATIEAKELNNSIIGIRAHIKKGTIIRDSIVLGNHQTYPAPIQFSIGENCVIQKAIIDEESMIGNNVKLINKKGLQTYDGDGIYIRDGITIVTTGASLPDGFQL